MLGSGEGKQVLPSQFPCLLPPGTVLVSGFLEPGCQQPPSGLSKGSFVVIIGDGDAGFG